MYLDEIARLVNWSGTGTQPDWASIESKREITFPRDYKDYVSRFRLGSFRTFLTIYPPFEKDIEEVMDTVIENLNMARRGVGRDFPLAIYPDPGGLFPWGLIEHDFVICWDTRDEIPENWPIVMVDNVLANHWTHPGPMTKFIVDFCRGTTGIDELSYIDDAPVFFEEFI